jgi:hypothetical protein
LPWRRRGRHRPPPRQRQSSRDGRTSPYVQPGDRVGMPKPSISRCARTSLRRRISEGESHATLRPAARASKPHALAGAHGRPDVRASPNKRSRLSRLTNQRPASWRASRRPLRISWRTRSDDTPRALAAAATLTGSTVQAYLSPSNVWQEYLGRNKYFLGTHFASPSAWTLLRTRGSCSTSRVIGPGGHRL